MVNPDIVFDHIYQSENSNNYNFVFFGQWSINILGARWSFHKSENFLLEQILYNNKFKIKRFTNSCNLYSVISSICYEIERLYVRHSYREVILYMCCLAEVIDEKWNK